MATKSTENICAVQESNKALFDLTSYNDKNKKF